MSEARPESYTGALAEQARTQSLHHRVEALEDSKLHPCATTQSGVSFAPVLCQIADIDARDRATTGFEFLLMALQHFVTDFVDDVRS
jgi:hypothetical protein